MSVRCTICHRDLPETEFYANYLKRYQYQCKECTKVKNNKYKKEISEYPEKEFGRYYGGFTLTILNYPSPYRYAIKGTNGFFFQTNNINEFLEQIKIITDTYSQ